MEKDIFRRIILYSGIVAVCFLYTGSAYMSQFYRLIPCYDGPTVDLITSCLNYVVQALGILLFALGLRYKPALFGRRLFFMITLLTGLPFMVMMQIGRAHV